MELAKLTNGKGLKLPIGRYQSPAKQGQKDAARLAGQKTVPRKAAQKEADSARSIRKEKSGKSKSDKLVCRYCGSDDLAPSFIKRRDRRCRKCFSKRYGSTAALASKAKIKK
jgi:hypothetical protein